VRVYLAGPIFGCEETAARAWRVAVGTHLESLGHHVIDPMWLDFRGDEERHRDDIVEIDKANIRRCDALFVRYEAPTAGTCMEMLYGWEHGKLVVLWMDAEMALSPWVQYHSDAIGIGVAPNAMEKLTEDHLAKARQRHARRQMYG